MAEKKDLEQTPYNMAFMYYISLNKLVEHKDARYLENDLGGWYKGLRAIYRKIIFKLNKDERSRADEMFKKVESLFNAPTNLTQKYKKNNSFIVSQKLDHIDQELTILMDKKNMIFPKGMYKGLDYLYRKYDLEQKQEVTE